ncbi:hypothetical protein DPMN_015382 [Dreissena polymorpha]|uniref:Uncharacterized protein n=1 Tax=Dreissena polymorpha TaxID=45954 RepID=A0A9D4NCQ0_DREPO|nr:hypothetical protein DPMN_015382 [Dreissena polymorpha]
MNLLTKFHEDWTINVASRMQNALPLESHVFQAKVTIFQLIQDIIGTNLLTKFREDRKIKVVSRMFTRKNAPPPGGHVFQPTRIIFKLQNALPLGSHVFQAKVTIFELIQDIIGKNLLSKFHEDRKINVDSIEKKCPAPWRPYIIGMNLLTKFYEDWTINVASRMKNALPLGSHVFQANVTIFELNLFTCFHYILIEKNAPPTGSHVFSPIWTIFKLVRDINETNVSTKFHDDWEKILHEGWASNVTSTVFTSFELNRLINVASRVFTRQNVDDGRGRKGDHKSSP